MSSSQERKNIHASGFLSQSEDTVVGPECEEVVGPDSDSDEGTELCDSDDEGTELCDSDDEGTELCDSEETKEIDYKKLYEEEKIQLNSVLIMWRRTEDELKMMKERESE